MTFAIPPRQPDDADLTMRVRAAAERLVDDLGRAEGLTAGWSDERLSDTLVDDALGRCLAALAETGCRGEANRLPSGELWRVAGPLLRLGSLQQHARLKPRGYPGDYEMLTRIWDQSCCDDPLGAAFDRYFLRQAAPAAVRSRTRQTAMALAAHRLESAEADYHVVSIGAGPAIDVAEGLALLSEESRRDVRVTLLDLDPESLEAARTRVEPLLSAGSPRCVRVNLFRFLDSPDAPATLDRPNLLICSGLLDYMDDAAAAAMLGLLWRQLAPGGRMLLGNFAPHTPTRAYMEWIGNWYLTYRTIEQFHRLGAESGIPAESFVIGTEPLGIDLFLIAQK